MSAKSLFIAITVLTLSAGTGIAYADEALGCPAGTKIDASSIDSARTKIKKAGFENIQALKKGCDNFWHGTALENGAPVNVALTPQGQVLKEGN
jgi:hypothetical protein